MTAVLGACIIYLSAYGVFGQKCAVDAGFRGSAYSIDRYKNRLLVKGVKSLDDIPLPARAKLIEHLRTKLGKKFFDKLKYDGGEWTDVEALRRESPDDYRRNAPMGAYDLRFKFSDSKRGLKYFYSKLVLNDDGSIREDLRLPNIGANPEKSRIISCKETIKIAILNGFPKESVSVDFDYSPTDEVFVWIITDTRATTPDDETFPFGLTGKGTFREILINANTGQVIRINKETIFL